MTDRPGTAEQGESPRRLRFRVPQAAGDLLDHLSWVHGMPYDRYKDRHLKADVVHQMHTDAHEKGHPGAINHDHSGKLRQTGWAEDPASPGRSKNGGVYSEPRHGNNMQIEAFLERHSL